MKYVFTLVLCCVLGATNGLFAQDIFQKHVGSTGSDFLTDMLRLPDGKFIAFGYSKSKTSDSTFAQLFKMDSSMNLLWSKAFTFNNQMRTTDITLANDGGFILAGRTWQTPAAVTKQGGFVIRTDSVGATRWTRIVKFDGSETMLKVMEETDNTLRYFVTGATTTHYMKAAADGIPTNAPVAPTNGAFDMVSHKVVKLAAERYALVGRFQNTADMIMVLNKDTIQWTKEYNGIINTGRILNIATDAKGDLYLAGDYKVSAYDIRQIHVAKLSANGNIRWTTVLPLVKLGGTGIDTTWRFTNGNSLQVSGRRVYVSGSMLTEQKNLSYGTISAFDTAALAVAGANWLWTRQYGARTGNSDSLARVFVLPNGQLVAGGHTGLGGNQGNPNFYFIKTDTSGISSCNFDSYSPVAAVGGTAYLSIAQNFVGLAPSMQTLTTYNDVIPNSTAVPLSTTATICGAALCPAGTLTAAISPVRVCRFDTLSISASGATAYLWSSLGMPNGTRTDSTFKHVVPDAGTFAFLLSGTPRGQNCFAAQSISVLVNPLPLQPISGVFAVPNFICLGDTLNVIGGSTATSTSIFTWTSPTSTLFNQTSAASKARITVRPASVGNHLFNLVIKDDNGCVNSGTAVVTVRPNVTPTVTFDPIGCPGPDLTLRARGTNEGATPYFDWLIEGSGLVGGRRELIVPNAIGKKVQVYMTVGGDVCPIPPGTRQVKSPVITVTCQGVATQTIAELQSLMVFPNPTTGDFTVKLALESAKTVGFRVQNLLGQIVQVVAPRKFDSGETLQSFQLKDVAKGLYLIETNIEGKRIISKVQVQ